MGKLYVKGRGYIKVDDEDLIDFDPLPSKFATELIDLHSLAKRLPQRARRRAAPERTTLKSIYDLRNALIVQAAIWGYTEQEISDVFGIVKSRINAIKRQAYNTIVERGRVEE